MVLRTSNSDTVNKIITLHVINDRDMHIEELVFGFIMNRNVNPLLFGTGL